MRWRFADPRNREEAAHKARVMENVDAWWEAFAAAASQIDSYYSQKAEGAFDIPQFMQRHFNPIDHRICWEYGGALKSAGHRLIFTPETYRFLHPVVEMIVSRAPRLPRWEFYIYRQSEPPDWAHAYVRGRSRNTLNYPDAQAKLSRGENNLIDITIRATGMKSNEDQDARNGAFMLTEALLGEENLDKWVGVVSVEPMRGSGFTSKLFGRASDSGGFLPLKKVKATFDALKESIRDQLPDRPLHELDLMNAAPWSSYKREPRENNADDEPGRELVYIGTSARFEVARACIASGFSGQRFSRFGETFCYLKLDWSAVERSKVIEWRGGFEDILESSLRREKLGCIYGTATSNRYTHIDLAVTDINRAVDIIRATLRPLLAPKRSWLLFFEPEYEQEWVGIWDDAPPPPAREDGSVS